jgi:hypothetical protein
MAPGDHQDLSLCQARGHFLIVYQCQTVIRSIPQLEGRDEGEESVNQCQHMTTTFRCHWVWLREQMGRGSE